MAPIKTQGEFYLGKRIDRKTGQLQDDRLLYDARDLTTHAVCVGMTGSGKTGLCISLLEEAALDGIPALVIDPKGDIGNMLLTFPDLLPDDFRPWIDEQAAARKGITPDEFAAAQADLWRNGLAEWGQDGERIRLLREKADLSIYTPGSSAGRPLRLLRSFDAPSQAVIDDADILRERVGSTVSGILGLLSIDDDPVTSQPHMLLSMILDHAWRDGRNLDFASLVAEIQDPPFDKVGVLDLESVIPSKDRFKLAMAVNTLLASPTFSTWTQGEPLDIDRLMHTENGKPRVTILSISHLSESERMFFVTILLNEVVSWVRSQSGTSSLRGLLYMDEVFGFFPPVAEPPTKRPMLTLLKQARAYGFGCVLATQNPVDLDYKGLSNAGTWFIGRLQTERDLRRVLDGLEGASATAGAAFNTSDMEQLLAGLKSRVFLMNNVHGDGPTLFHTRWAMSYLRGPLTRDHIRALTPDDTQEDQQEATREEHHQPPGEDQTTPVPANQPAGSASRPPIPPDLDQGYLPATELPGPGETLVYTPAVMGSVSLHYVRVAAKIDEWIDCTLLAPITDNEHRTWAGAAAIENDSTELDDDGEPGATYRSLPAWAMDSRQAAAWAKELKNSAYRDQSRTIYHCKTLKIYSRLDQPKAEFFADVEHALKDKARDDAEAMREKAEPKLAALDERIRKARQRVDSERSQWRSAGADSAVSLVSAIFGKLLGSGRKKVSTSIGKACRAMKQRGDIGRAKQNVEALLERRASLVSQLEDDINAIESAQHDPAALCTPIVVRPRKGDMTIRPLTLVWVPPAASKRLFQAE
ncbi:MAG: DUF87 domain-containing protein [Planctomycetota bacterium]